jgi:hypothetical protein
MIQKPPASMIAAVGMEPAVVHIDASGRASGGGDRIAAKDIPSGPGEAKTPQLHKALELAHWRAQGLVGLVKRYEKVRSSWRTAFCDNIPTVV